MANIIDNNISFNPTIGKQVLNGKLYRGANKGVYNEGDTSDGIEKIVNAVEIDWNGAQLGE